MRRLFAGVIVVFVLLVFAPTTSVTAGINPQKRIEELDRFQKKMQEWDRRVETAKKVNPCDRGNLTPLIIVPAPDGVGTRYALFGREIKDPAKLNLTSGVMVIHAWYEGRGIGSCTMK